MLSRCKACFPTKLLVAAICLAVFASVSHAEVEKPEQSKVYALTITDFVDGKHDLVMYLFMREGKVHHGYTRVPQRDQLAGRLDPTPGAPIEYIVDGKKFDPPESQKSNYDYKNDQFRKYRQDFYDGKVIMRNVDVPQPIAVTNDAITGVFDIWVLRPDEPVGSNDGARRFKVDLKRDGDAYKGTYTTWQYDEHDETLGADAPKQSGNITGEALPDYWKPAPDSEFAKGKDWPNVRGPNFNGSAIDSDRPIVSNLSDARIAWVAEIPIPAGRGGIPRSDFGFFPLTASGLGDGAFGAPIIHDGKVYLYITASDEKLLDEAGDKVTKHPYVIRGADRRVVADEVNAMRDTLYCFDARTGAQIWTYRGPNRFAPAKSGKGGRGLTPCIAGDLVIFRGNSHLYALNRETGELAWRTGGPGKDAGYGYGATGNWSRDESPVVIDGVGLVNVGSGADLAAFDPKTGEPLWHRKDIAGSNAIPLPYEYKGKTCILVAESSDEKNEVVKGKLSLLDPMTCEIVWQSDKVGDSPATPLVWDDIVATNITPTDNKGSVNKQQRYTGGVRITGDDGELVWTNKQVMYDAGRWTPLAHKGYFVIDSRESGFDALDAKTGKSIGSFPHIYSMTWGSHNWTWHVASNNQVITSGLLHFQLGDGEFYRLPGRLSVDIASGYVCPIKPALADGRIVMRTADKLVCYDLRESKENREIDSIRLVAHDAAKGVSPDHDNVQLHFRLVDGKVTQAVCEFPRFIGAEGAPPAVMPWGWPTNLQWKRSPIDDAKLTDHGMQANFRLAAWEHWEDWTVDLKRQGDQFEGTYQRRIAPLAKPFEAKGQLTGEIKKYPDGRIRWQMRIDNAVQYKSEDPTHIDFAIDKAPDGSRQAVAAHGKFNQSGSEVDASGVTITDDVITGDMIVIFHSDRYRQANSEFGGALAGKYTLDAKIKDGKITGSYTGVAGIEHIITGKLEGKLRKNLDVMIEK